MAARGQLGDDALGERLGRRIGGVDHQFRVVGGLVGRMMPVNSLISPARALVEALRVALVSHSASAWM